MLTAAISVFGPGPDGRYWWAAALKSGRRYVAIVRPPHDRTYKTHAVALRTARQAMLKIARGISTEWH